MPVRFHALVHVEIDEAFSWYESQLAGLGKQLVDEAIQAVARIEANPYLYPVIKANIRRSLLVRFPYKVIYAVDETGIFITAFSHQRRRPNYWVKRTAQ